MTKTKTFAQVLTTLSLGAALALGACSKKEEAAETKPAAEKPAADTTAKAPEPDKAPEASGPDAEANKIFETRCVACHGATGIGDGPAAASLDPKPANYSDATWQESVTDQQIEDAIAKGGAAVGKSVSMPANPDLAAKPEVLAALRKKIRAFGGK